MKEVFLKNLNHWVVFSFKLGVKCFVGFVRLRPGDKDFLELQIAACFLFPRKGRSHYLKTLM